MVIDVRGKVANNFDYLVSLGDVAVWERDNAQIPVGAYRPGRRLGFDEGLPRRQRQ